MVGWVRIVQKQGKIRWKMVRSDGLLKYLIYILSLAISR